MFEQSAAPALASERKWTASQLHARHDATDGLRRATKTVLICGRNAFAAKGLEARLRESGHSVYTFSRGPLSRESTHVTGPVHELHANTGFPAKIDVVVNYIYLQNEPVSDNLAYLASLLRFCASRGVKHLIHISSCSVYKNSARLIGEETPIEKDPLKKGPYGSIKATAESYLAAEKPPELKVSHLRPGLILGSEIRGYMGGIGIRLPWNNVLGVGCAKSRMPLITRKALTDVILQTLENPPKQEVENLLLAASDSPTRREYLDACCEVLGSGVRVHWVPRPVWLCTAAVADFGARLIGKKHWRILSKVSSVCRVQTFDPSQSERRTGMSFSSNWRSELGKVLDGQEKNYSVPEVPNFEPLNGAPSVAFIGFGRIVKTRHWPALRRCRFKGDVQAYDLAPRRDPDTGVEIAGVGGARLDRAGLFVVATPGPIHVEAIDLLQDAQGPVLVEKPLCYDEAQLEKWLAFAQARGGDVFVCQNSLLRRNVVQMLGFLNRYNPGKLHHVSVHFQSPPVLHDPALWLRDERKARTLLLDYGIHSLHLGAVFGRGEAEVLSCRSEIDGHGNTSLIQGEARFENHSLSFLLRQGFIPRKMSVCFTFQNYSVRLGFSPDTFLPEMANTTIGLAQIETGAAWKATLQKAAGKLTGRENDDSHARVISAAFHKSCPPLEIQNVAPFYRLCFEISRRVYGR